MSKYSQDEVIYNKIGDNRLCKLLMQLRDELCNN